MLRTNPLMPLVVAVGAVVGYEPATAAGATTAGVAGSLSGAGIDEGGAAGSRPIADPPPAAAANA